MIVYEYGFHLGGAYDYPLFPRGKKIVRLVIYTGQGQSNRVAFSICANDSHLRKIERTPGTNRAEHYHTLCC